MTPVAPVSRRELPLLEPQGGAEGRTQLVVGPVLSAAAAETLATSLRALADPTRLRLVSLVAAHPDREACVCDLTAPVGLAQPTVSHHLKVLVDAGILTREQRGRWAYYRLVPDTLVGLARLISP